MFEEKNRPRAREHVVVLDHTGRLGRIRRRAEGRTRQTAVYFPQPPQRNPIARVLVPRSGVSKPKKRTFKAPAPHSAPRGGRPECAPPHAPLPTGPRHGAGIRPPEGRHASSGHIRARLTPVLYRPSFVVVVSGSRAYVRDNRRLVVIQPRLLV